MSSFINNAITDVGRQLWAEIQAGGTFTVTKIVMGSGYMPSGKTTRTMTAVETPVINLSVNKKAALSGGDFVFGAMFSNQDVQTAFYFRELALYAKVVREDSTETSEILYSYGNAGADAELIPAYSAGTVVERQIDIVSYVGNDATVNLTVATGIYVPRNEYDAKMDEIDEDIASKQDKTNNLTEETTLVDSDTIPFYDTSASAHKKTSWSNIKSKLKTHFDSIYGTYTRPSGGIPKTDLASAVQTSLDNADSAVQDISGKQDKTNNLTEETTIVDGDYFPFYDASAVANKKTSWSNIKAKLKTYFDSLYAAATHNHDDRYYTESEINAILSGKANVSHSHAQTDITGLVDVLAGKLEIETGTYIGEGVVGSGSPNSLSFGIKPMVVFVKAATTYNNGIVCLRGCGASSVNPYASSPKWNLVTFGDNSISWYSDDSAATPWDQLNEFGITYRYIAIGLERPAAALDD